MFSHWEKQIKVPPQLHLGVPMAQLVRSTHLYESPSHQFRLSSGKLKPTSVGECAADGKKPYTSSSCLSTDLSTWDLTEAVIREVLRWALSLCQLSVTRLSSAAARFISSFTLHQDRIPDNRNLKKEEVWGLMSCGYSPLWWQEGGQLATTHLQSNVPLFSTLGHSPLPLPSSAHRPHPAEL